MAHPFLNIIPCAYSMHTEKEKENLMEMIPAGCRCFSFAFVFVIPKHVFVNSFLNNQKGRWTLSC